MTNETSLDGKYLGTISADFVKVTDTLKEASYLIRKQETYTYPIFVMAQVPLSMGALLIEKMKQATSGITMQPTWKCLYRPSSLQKIRLKTFSEPTKTRMSFVASW